MRPATYWSGGVRHRIDARYVQFPAILAGAAAATVCPGCRGTYPLANVIAGYCQATCVYSAGFASACRIPLWKSPPVRALRRPVTATHTPHRSEEHTSELQSLMRNSYAVFCLKKKITK